MPKQYKIKDLVSGKFLNNTGLAVFSPKGGVFSKKVTVLGRMRMAEEYFTLHGNSESIDLIVVEVELVEIGQVDHTAWVV